MMQQLRTMPPPRLQQLNYGDEMAIADMGGLQQLNGDDEMAMADMGLQQLSTTGVFRVAKDAMDFLKGLLNEIIKTDHFNAID